MGDLADQTMHLGQALLVPSVWRKPSPLLELTAQVQAAREDVQLDEPARRALVEQRLRRALELLVDAAEQRAPELAESRTLVARLADRLTHIAREAAAGEATGDEYAPDVIIGALHQTTQALGELGGMDLTDLSQLDSFY